MCRTHYPKNACGVHMTWCGNRQMSARKATFATRNGAVSTKIKHTLARNVTIAFRRMPTNEIRASAECPGAVRTPGRNAGIPNGKPADSLCRDGVSFGRRVLSLASTGNTPRDRCRRNLGGRRCHMRCACQRLRFHVRYRARLFRKQAMRSRKTTKLIASRIR